MKAFNTKYNKILELAMANDPELKKDLKEVLSHLTEEEKEKCKKGISFGEEKDSNEGAEYSNHFWCNETPDSSLIINLPKLMYELILTNIDQQFLDKLYTLNSVEEAFGDMSDEYREELWKSDCVRAAEIMELYMRTFNSKERNKENVVSDKNYYFGLVKTVNGYVFYYSRQIFAKSGEMTEKYNYIPVSNEELNELMNLDCPMIDSDLADLNVD